MSEAVLGRASRRSAVPATIQAATRARALRDAGHDVLSLALGEPDGAPPPHVIAALGDAARRGETKYPPVAGTAALRDAVRRKFTRENGLDGIGADEVIVSTGSKQAIHEFLSVVLDDGDEVVIPSPYWASYPLMVRSVGGRPVFVPCDEADGFRLDPDALGRAIGPRTKAVLLNFPNNPTGAVCEADRLRAIAGVLRRAPAVWIASDDIYEHLIHDGSPHATIAAVAPDLRARTLTIGGVSKSWAMTGFRIGFATGPAFLIAAMGAVQGNTTSGASSVCQAAATAALDGPTDARDAMRARYAARRDMALARLGAIEHLDCRRPDGAFYLYPSVARLIGRRSAGGAALVDDDAIATALLEEAHLAVVSGSAFGASPYLRLSIAASDDVLTRAFDRLARFCASTVAP